MTTIEFGRIRGSDWSDVEWGFLTTFQSLLRQRGAEFEAINGITDNHDPWLVLVDEHGNTMLHVARVRDYPSEDYIIAKGCSVVCRIPVTSSVNLFNALVGIWFPDEEGGDQWSTPDHAHHSIGQMP